MANNNSESGKSIWKTIAENFDQAVEQKNRSIPEELSVSAPYAGAVVQPSGYAPTAGGTWGDVAKSIYNNTMSRYNELKGLYQDQTEEAKKIRSSWQTAPTVRLENGRFKLSGSSDFLKSAEAKQLRDTLKEMKGNSYNTEDLNRQIEAWNATLSKMSEQYMNSLGTLNSLNAALAQNVEGTTREDFQKYFTFNDLQKIGNSAAVGKQNDARTTKSKIFVGFEWDDDGNRIEKWVDAADFFNEFNSQSDDAKRSAYHSLVTQANLGDVGAYSKLMYLQGGSQGGPANVDIDGTGTFFENILQGAEAGAAGAFQDILDYAPILNFGTISSNISNAAENADERNFWDWAAAIMAPGLYADKYDSRTGLLKVYNDAVTDFNNLRDWSNTYTAELNPASTEIGRTVGDVTGGALRIAGDIYAFGKLGQLQADTKFAAMQIANQKFAGSKAFTPMGQIYIKKYGVKVTDQVTPLANNGGVATMGRTLSDTTTIIPFGGIYVPTVLTKISPKFTQFLEEAALAFTEVQFARNASQFISKDGTTVLQFGTAKPTGTKVAWSDKGIGAVVEPMTQAQWRVDWGPMQRFTSGSNIESAWDIFSKTAGDTVSSSTTLSGTVNFSRSYELLKSLRNKDTVLGISKGLQTAQALSNLVGFAAMRNVDEYFQRAEAGEDVGDMANYVITHTAEDAVWGGLIMKAGGMMKFFKRGADASAKPTVEYVQEVFDGMANSQSGWYMPGSYASNRFSLGPGELTASESADLADTLSSIMTVNGEAVTGFTGELGGVSAVPGTNIKEAGKALGVYSPSKITRLSVRPANGGAYLVREETNLDTNIKVETRQFYTDIEEATKAAGSEAVPKTTPATIANSDVATGAKVAPLTIDGKAPNVMPDGVSQIRVEPGIVYRTPDNVAESLINIAAQEGWHETNQDRLYREYEQYQREVEAQQNAMEILSAEAPALPREMYGTDIESILRIAAAAKVAGYNYIPFRIAPKRSRIIKKFSMQDKFISKLADKYNFPEISPEDMLKGENTLRVNDEVYREHIDNAGPLVYAVNGNIDRADFYDPLRTTSFIGKKPKLDSILSDKDSTFLRAIGAAYVLAGRYYDTIYTGLDPHNANGDVVTKENVEALLESAGLSSFKTGRTAGVSNALRILGREETKQGAIAELERVMSDGFNRWAADTWLNYIAPASRSYKPAQQVVESVNSAIKDYAKILADEFYDDARKIYSGRVSGEKALKASAEDEKLNEAVEKRIKEFLYPALDKYVDEAFKNTKTSLSTGVRVPVSKVDDKLIYRPEVSAEDAVIAHIPAGTKVLYYDPFPGSKDRKFGHISGYIFDASEGIAEKNGEIFVNTYGGKEYVPSEREYTQSDYAIYNDYDDAEGYIKLGKEMMKPIITPQAKEKVFKMVEPGGNINAMNRLLREHEPGKLPRDTIKTRTGYARDFLEETFRSSPNKDKYGNTLYRIDTTYYPNGGAGISMLIKQVKDRILHRYEDFKTQGSRINKLEKVWSLINNEHGKGWMRTLDAVIEAKANDITKEELKAGLDFFDEVRFGLQDIEDKYEDIYIKSLDKNSSVKYDPEELYSDLKIFLDKLDKKYGKKFPVSKRDLSDRMRLVDSWGRKGSHKLALPKGVNYIWTFRGANETGNGVNPSWNNRNMKNRMSDWVPGEHYNASSLDFASMNQATPFHYSDGNSSDAGDEYIIATAHPNGTGVFYYGDPEHFGDRVHYGDGGAIVTPYGNGFTVVAIRKLGKNRAGKDVKLVITVRDNADGTPYSGPIEGQGDAVSKITERVREDQVIEEPNNFAVTAYGIPFEYFPTAEEALDFASQSDVFKVHELSDEPLTLDRPPVTTETLDEPLLLESGASAEGYLEKLTGLLQSMQEMEDSDINYSYGIIDALKQVRGIYGQVSANVNLTDIYARYAQSIYDNEMIELTPDERKALKPLTDALDALGHYFDPSGKSLTQEFYLPTGAATRNKVSIEEALLGKDEIVDVEFPADGGLEEILIDADRIGDSGFWQRRTGELFMDSEGNFTMSKAASLEDNLIAYTVSALTRGPHKLTLAVNNEVARSKANPNRTQITAKQARAMLQEADTLRTTTRAFQLGTHKDAEKIAKLKMDYTGDESTVDQALKEKNYAKKLNYTRTLNTLSQKGGFNQFLDIHPIKGSVTRFGAGPYKGTANIKRKMSEINITGTMYKYDNGHWENYGFGIEASQANIKKYGVFKDGGDAVNLGEILKFNFESQQRALDFYGKLKEDIKSYATTGNGEALQVRLDELARGYFPLHTNIDSFSAKLMKEFGKNLYAHNNDVVAAEAANTDSVEKWLRTGALICFNNAIQMGDIQNLDARTIEALDDAAAELLLGSPVKRSTAINFLQRWSVDSALTFNANLVIGNVGAEIFTRLPGYVGTPETIRAVVNALRPSEFRRVRNILKDLPLHFDDSNGALARRVYNRVSEAVSKGEDVALSPLNWSELFKNVVYYLAGERNAIKNGAKSPEEIGQQALDFVGEHAIAGGRGTTPGIAQSDLGRVLFIFKTFTIRNFDDFLDFVKKASHGRSGDNYWDKKYEKRHKGDDKDTIDLKIAARVIGGRAFRSYIFWLFIGSYLGKSLLDILGGDPTGILEGGYDRGLYDDPDTPEYEGMTGFDELVNNFPAGFILGALQDLYFAARRRGIESKQFFGFDIFNDPRLQKDLSKKLPLGVAKNRLGDMLSLLDRGYSFSSTGKKTYAAPDTVWDLTKGFLFGKSTTANSLAYGKYRYGNVNVWGDISSGDWMDFAINANPLTDIFGGSAKFDTTRKDYTGVFDGSWNDIATMQLIVQQFRERNKQIIANFQENKYKWTGEYQGLSDAEKLAKAKEQRDKDIDKFTDDVQRAVDAFEKAGNILSDKQISTMVNLFDFHEGEEDEEWNSSYARQRYIEAGLPDYNAATITRGTKTVDGEKQEVTKNILDRSLLLQNAQQGYYGSSKEAANAVKDALRDFKPTYQQYNKRVKELNNKYFEARNKNKKSATTKQLSKELESLQNEYLDKLFDKLEPVMDEYGTALVGTYDVADVLESYMGNMIPYSSIRKYGQTYSSGNDIVYGQLTEWLQKRLGRNAPTAASDKEVTNGIADIKKLLDQGKTSAARSKARAILEKIGRGSLGARNYDVETLRGYAYD